ncbi:MAG: mannose-6-phosphate isomerase, class I [Desulfobacteraceae bacterium]|nr:MAG: mannose-6-phosphate isomerase, class I [Desulfobacteraceae bacterium]
MLKLQNTIQPYAWGSYRAIAELLGQSGPADHPQAELWMGAHAKAPSKVWFQGRWQGLDGLIRQDPLPFLGEAVVDRFGPQLPFLFKVLAVDKPLSVQAHPSKAMAIEGFARENAQGIALSAPHRNYRDDHHKPECVCALTSFQALCGFRSPRETISLLEPVWPPDRRAELEILKSGMATHDLRAFFIHLMRMDTNRRADLISRVVFAADPFKHQNDAYRWLIHLNDAYPNDMGVLSPVLLHLIELEPGQALFLPAGRLHAYLHGLAIEIMANSDNVLRGGLTPKHIDVDELLGVLDFEARPLQVITPQVVSPREKVYPSHAEEFRLSSIQVQPAHAHAVNSHDTIPEILLCIEGSAQFIWTGSSKGLEIKKGESVFVPAAVTDYEIHGKAILYKATVGV